MGVGAVRGMWQRLEVAVTQNRLAQRGGGVRWVVQGDGKSVYVCVVVWVLFGG